MSNVTVLNTVTRLDIPVERVLSSAQEKGLESAVVIGWDADGDFYFASSVSDGAETLWLLEIAKKRLLEIGTGDV